MKVRAPACAVTFHVSSIVCGPHRIVSFHQNCRWNLTQLTARMPPCMEPDTDSSAYEYWHIAEESAHHPQIAWQHMLLARPVLAPKLDVIFLVVSVEVP